MNYINNIVYLLQNKMLLDKPISNIENLIPQKAPFVMVDTLLGFSCENT